jgi:hypothetical protein
MKIRLEAQLNVNVRWDEAAKVYVSHAPALDIYSQATTEAEALRAIESAMRLYLITAIETNKIDDVVRRFAERVPSGNGPESPDSKQRITILQGDGCQVTSTRVPLELTRG